MAERLRYVNTASSAGGNGTTNGTAGATRAYASSQECESAEQADLDTANDTFRAVCEGSAEDTGGLTINGWVTDATYHITWETSSGAGRHDGTISGVANAYKLTRADDRALGLASTGRLDLKIRGFIIRAQSNHFGISDVGIGAGTGRVEIERMIVYSSTSGSSGRGINIAAGTCWIWNTFVYGFNSASSVGYGISSAGATIVAENVTVRRCRFGFVVVSGSITCYNCIASGCVSGGYSGASGGSHNVSYTTDAPGTNNTNSSTPTYVGTDDCRLNSSDTVAKDTGTDRSGGTIAFSTDIAGTTRPQNGTWDRGAFEVVAGGSASGSGTPSLSVVTASGSGIASHPGSGAGTLSVVTASGTGKDDPRGQAAISIPAIVAAGVAVAAHPGTGSISIVALTSSGSGISSHPGTGSPSLTAITSSGSGTRTSSGGGIGALSIPAITSSGSGVAAHVGSSSASLPAVTSSGSGRVAPRGEGSPSLSSVTASGAGVSAHVSSAALSLVALIASGIGRVGIVGAGNLNLSSVSLSGTGSNGVETVPISKVEVLSSNPFKIEIRAQSPFTIENS